jgi:hypothetical protein
MHFELSISITAVLEAKRLELMLASAECHRRHLDRARVRPIATLELSSVDTDEGAITVVSVEAEGVGSCR